MKFSLNYKGVVNSWRQRIANMCAMDEARFSS